MKISRKLRKCEIKNSSKSAWQTFWNFGSKCDSTPKNQQLYSRFSSNPRWKTCFYNLGWELNCACPLFIHTLMWHHVSRVRKQEFFWLVAYGLFCHILLALGVNTCLKALWNYHYVHRSDLMPFKSWICFHFFFFLLASFLHAWLILNQWRPPGNDYSVRYWVSKKL